MDIFQFMSDSPILTGFIFVGACQLVVSVVRSITGKYPKEDEE